MKQLRWEKEEGKLLISTPYLPVARNGFLSLRACRCKTLGSKRGPKATMGFMSFKSHSWSSLDVFKCLSWSMRLLIGIVSKYCSELLLSASSRKPTGTLDCISLQAIGKKDFIAVRTSWIYTSLKVIEPIGQHLQYMNYAQHTKVVSLPIIELETQVKCYTLLVSYLNSSELCFVTVIVVKHAVDDWK